jgi:hypothetical protein
VSKPRRERYRYTLTPQMRDYDIFTDPAEFRYVPYLMNAHRTDYRSAVINTDRLGFRFSHGNDDAVGSVTRLPPGPVNLLAGSSSAFGLGATSDRSTVPSLLWRKYAPRYPWLNFSGRAYNSTQELLLFVLYRHKLAAVSEIVVLSGVNNLALSRLPLWQRGDHGAFHFCGEYFDKMDELLAQHRSHRVARWRRMLPNNRPKRRSQRTDEQTPLNDAISRAVELTARHLAVWRILADAANARLSFVLQPFASWIRDSGSPQEELLFHELDDLSEIPYEKLYGNIVPQEAGRAYADALQAACDSLGIHFLDLNPVMAEALTPDQWVFIDRRHYTDEGSELVSEFIARDLQLT